MTIRRTAIAAVACGALALAACGGGEDAETVTKTVTAPPATSEAETPIPDEVTRVLDALDELDADYTDPVEDDPGELSGAERTFELDIVDYSAGINMFATADDLDVWQEASDDFGGVSVTFDTTAVSLNSDEGKDASLALAPQLAEKLGGEAHTGGEEPDYTPSGDQAAAEDASAPIPGVDCPRSVLGDTNRCADPAEAQAEGDATEQFWRDHPELLQENQTYTDPYRSDGCVGPAATCGYYDDNGNPIWFDKETGETSPRYYDENGNPTMEAP
ncbi:MAG: hypothetical protein ACI38U_10235 [Corynebacterium sp.]|uniref:hypothetical protein n=1 Tax=Corynebacterium sp. TaxID=1720 RepID=UPI003F02AD24